MTFRRESTVCSTDGGELKIVDRWRDKENFQDLPQEWTGSTRFRKSWQVLSEETKPLAEGDLSPNVKGDILALRPTSQQGKRWNEKISAKCCDWSARSARSFVLYSLVQ